MEKSANFTAVGVICFVLIFGLTIFIVWLARFQFTRQYDTYDIVFDGPVRGLSVGGEVHFNGIKVGEITHLALDPADPTRVIARTRVTIDVPIRRESLAQLEPEGITGVNYVQIGAGNPVSPLLKTTVRAGEVPLIHSRRSTLDGLFQDGGTAMTRTVDALDRVTRVLSDENIASVAETLAGVRTLGEQLRSHPTLVADVQQTIQDADAAVRQAHDVLARLDGPVTDFAAHGLPQATATLAELHDVLAHIDGPVTDFAASGLPQATATLAELQQATEHLDRLVQEMRANPRGLITRPPPSELEVPQ